MKYAEIKEDLSFLENWEDRLEYVIDLGKTMDELDESERNAITKVEGCASQVWLVPEIENGKFRFRGQSDALIVSGLIAVLLAMVDSKSGEEILSLDLRGEFEKLGLAAHLSGQRSNGLNAMVERINNLATQAG